MVREVTDGRLSLEVMRDAFASLAAPPDPMSVDGHAIVGLPDRAIPLDELRDLLLRKSCGRTTRDEAWRLLIRRARTDGPAWTLACVGVALPALTASAMKLSRWFRGDLADLHAALIGGFLTALSSLDTAAEGLAVRLRWAAHQAGHAAAVAELTAPLPAEITDTADGAEAVPAGYRSMSPHRPWGHPDLVLARAIGDGVLTPAEAELIGATRLEGVPLAQWAAEHRTKYATANTARWRAEQRLVAYLSDQQLDVDPHDPLAPVARGESVHGTSDGHATGLRAVSGRARNGRSPLPTSRSRSVKDSGRKSCLLRCRDVTPASRPSPPRRPDSEDRRCA